MTRICLAILVTVTLSVGLGAQSGLSFDVITGEDAKYLEKKFTSLQYHTILWTDWDRVLFLTYRNSHWILNVDKRSGSVAVRLD